MVSMISTPISPAPNALFHENHYKSVPNFKQQNLLKFVSYLPPHHNHIRNQVRHNSQKDSHTKMPNFEFHFSSPVID
jgi:hypothetical protein